MERRRSTLLQTKMDLIGSFQKLKNRLVAYFFERSATRHWPHFYLPFGTKTKLKAHVRETLK